jgi:cupin fold WbuC family metalloprotein
MSKIFRNQQLDELTHKASQSERLRAHLNIHESLDAAVQRLFIATEPDTYMRPHRHPQAHKWELMILLNGKIDMLVFNDDGILTQREVLSASDVRVVEIPPNTWHAYVSQQPGTVILEIKQGAYLPTPAEDFATWSPAENTPQAAACLQWMRDATVGSKY